MPRFSREQQRKFVPAAAVIQQPPRDEAQAVGYTANPEVTAVQRQTACLAQRMCAAYGAQMRRWRTIQTGQQSNYTDDWQNPCWLRAVQAMQELGCQSPEQYVLAQFSANVPLAPAQLAGQAARAAYAAFKQSCDARSRGQWQSESAVFQSACAEMQANRPHCDARQVWEHVLRSLRVPLSPLFRYCLAVAEDMPETANILRAAALDQYLRDPLGFDKNWAGKIPNDLRVTADALLTVTI